LFPAANAGAESAAMTTKAAKINFALNIIIPNKFRDVLKNDTNTFPSIILRYYRQFAANNPHGNTDNDTRASKRTIRRPTGQEPVPGSFAAKARLSPDAFSTWTLMLWGNCLFLAWWRVTIFSTFQVSRLGGMFLNQ